MLTDCGLSGVNTPAVTARVCVSALSGGGGKTLFSLGLARALTQIGQTVKPFKKGPDYIDAAWLALAAGQPVTNLDPYFLSPARLRDLFVHAVTQAKAVEKSGKTVLGLVEGNRGLYDGLDTAGSCSTAALARALDCPILLSLNCTKMTRTAAALVQGVCNFEPGLTFCGLVLSHVGSARHETVLRRALEYYTDMPVLGALPRLSENPLPERRMGIASFGERLSATAENALTVLASFVREHVDVAAVLAAAHRAPALREESPFWREDAAYCMSVTSGDDGGKLATRRTPLCKPRIGYVHDEALWFYYQENLDALSLSGAELTRLSLLDGAAWPRLDGLYLGGGFPEDMAAELSASPHLSMLVALAQSGVPVYAECGGFMLLARGIERDGRLWKMSGFFPVTARFCEKPQGLGYVSARVVRENPWFPVGLALRGHEFHYSRCEWTGEAPSCAFLLERGTGMGAIGGAFHDGLAHNNVFAAYTHIFAPSVPCWAHNFTRMALNCQREQL